MRLNSQLLEEDDKERISAFAQWLLDIRNGQIGRMHMYISFDDAVPHDHDGGEVELLYSKEYLNSLSFAGLPPHRLELKVGTPIMLLCNINIIGGLCNGTRLIVTRLIVTRLLPKGTPIQANMDIKYADYFHQLLQLKKAYRITGFSCEQRGPWERTLENPTSHIFGRYIELIEIPNDGFPEHYFNFASYNELPARADIRNLVLTNYVGRIQVVNRIYTTGDATTNRIRRRTIDIQNLNGNTVVLTLWHEMALNFNVQEYEAMEKPVVITVSSCWVRRFNRDPIPRCKDHGPQSTMVYSDHKRWLSNHIRNLLQQSGQLTRDCNELLAELSDKDPYHLPSTLKDLEGTTHIFKFHFDGGSTTRKRDFILHRVFKHQPLPLPAPPAENLILPSTSHDQPERMPQPKPVIPALSTTASNEPDIGEIDTEDLQRPQFTPPSPKKITVAQKEDKPRNLP
ncbi:DNA helicase [Tanacetum coccineum]